MARVATEVERDGRNALAKRAAGGTVARFVLAHPALLARHVRINLGRLLHELRRFVPAVRVYGEALQSCGNDPVRPNRDFSSRLFLLPERK